MGKNGNKKSKARRQRAKAIAHKAVQKSFASKKEKLTAETGERGSREAREVQKALREKRQEKQTEKNLARSLQSAAGVVPGSESRLLAGHSESGLSGAKPDAASQAAAAAAAEAATTAGNKNAVLALPVLQDRIKRDPSAYVNEFRAQLRAFESQLEQMVGVTGGGLVAGGLGLGSMGLLDSGDAEAVFGACDVPRAHERLLHLQRERGDGGWGRR